MASAHVRYRGEAPHPYTQNKSPAFVSGANSNNKGITDCQISRMSASTQQQHSPKLFSDDMTLGLARRDRARPRAALGHGRNATVPPPGLRGRTFNNVRTTAQFLNSRSPSAS